MKTTKEYQLFLRECRKEIAVQNLTQKQVAQAVGADLSSFNGQLSGRSTHMSAARMLRVARFLGISLDGIMEAAS